MSQPDSSHRVGYVMTHYPRLAQTFIAGEIDAVEQAGVAVTCFAMNPPEPPERAASGAAGRIARTFYLKPRLLRGAALLAGQTLRHPLAMARVWALAAASGGASPLRIARRIAHLAQAALVADQARRAGISRLHAHFGLAPATIAWFATQIARAQGRAASFSFTIHGFHDFVDPAEARLELKAAAACAVLCISDFTRSQLALVTDPALWPRFAVARCGIDLARFTYRDPPERGAAVTVLALGRLSPEKGFAVLIDALAALRRAGRRVNLRLIGDGPLRSALEAQAAAQGLADAVHFTGELPPEQVRQELARADIFCMASFSEGLPVSLMEAMAVGVPVVSTWISGIPELAEHGVTALTVAPANSAALGHAIGRLVDDPALALDLARAARQRVEAQHDQARCGSQVAAALAKDAV